ncbi:MAG TPA: SulP family inorganic anion transporter [Gammaproteobacteria bacterium]|nr:SulP family inorganic anion transporter [Gammaproteobacteria bacterium]
MQQADGRILLFHLSGPMSFSSAKAMVRRHAAVTDYDIMLLDLTDTQSIDYTSARAMEDIIVDSMHAGRKVFLVGARPDVRLILERQKVTRHLDRDCIFANRLDALREAARHLQGNH